MKLGVQVLIPQLVFIKLRLESKVKKSHETIGGYYV